MRDRQTEEETETERQKRSQGTLGEKRKWEAEREARWGVVRERKGA